jgi:hypothetical protein
MQSDSECAAGRGVASVRWESDGESLVGDNIWNGLSLVERGLDIAMEGSA